MEEKVTSRAAEREEDGPSDECAPPECEASGAGEQGRSPSEADVDAPVEEKGESEDERKGSQPIDMVLREATLIAQNLKESGTRR